MVASEGRVLSDGRRLEEGDESGMAKENICVNVLAVDLDRPRPSQLSSRARRSFFTAMPSPGLLVRHWRWTAVSRSVCERLRSRPFATRIGSAPSNPRTSCGSPARKVRIVPGYSQTRRA